MSEKIEPKIVELGGRIVISSLKTVASKKLEEEINEELQVEDPDNAKEIVVANVRD